MMNSKEQSKCVLAHIAHCHGMCLPNLPAVVRSAAFKPLADVVNANSQPLLDEASAIGALASKLQPMAERAQQLQQERDNPVAVALAAAAAAAAAGAPSTTGSRRRTGGKGAKGDVAADAPDGGRDVVEGVEQQVRQMMGETGASLQQLKQLIATLGAASSQ
jgi:hypothetical protein